MQKKKNLYWWINPSLYNLSSLYPHTIKPVNLNVLYMLRYSTMNVAVCV